jgi:succinate dehydrogenase / fumarate reductase flavoprotein subunit
MRSALDGLKTLNARALKVAAPGNREYNPGWHTCMDLMNLMTVSEAVTLSALQRKESRGAQFRDDFPEKDAKFGKVNHVVRKAPDGSMQLETVTIPEMPAELKAVIEEMAK